MWCRLLRGIAEFINQPDDSWREEQEGKIESTSHATPLGFAGFM
jgi:hypothetical protein